jgi:DNA-binding transcriptional LysR family regulator
MVTLQQLAALVHISRSGSFQGAADRLGITQPSVSARIRDLERALGQPIFDRSGQTARLNGGGRKALQYAEKILSLSTDLTEAVGSSSSFVGTVKLGSSHTFAMTSLAELLRRIGELHPGVEFELDVDITNRLNEKLQASELDMAFVTEQVAGPNVRIEPFAPLSMVWVASPRLALPPSLAPARLVEFPVLTTSSPSPLAESVYRWFKRGGVIPNRVHRCTSVSILVDMVIAGLGVSLLPFPIIHKHLGTGELRVLRTKQRVASLRYCIAYSTTPSAPDLRFIGDIARDLARLEPWRSTVGAP